MFGNVHIALIKQLSNVRATGLQSGDELFIYWLLNVKGNVISQEIKAHNDMNMPN